MKKLALIILIALVACKKTTTNPTPSPTNPTPVVVNDTSIIGIEYKIQDLTTHLYSHYDDNTALMVTSLLIKNDSLNTNIPFTTFTNPNNYNKVMLRKGDYLNYNLSYPVGNSANYRIILYIYTNPQKVVVNNQMNYANATLLHIDSTSTNSQLINKYILK